MSHSPLLCPALPPLPPPASEQYKTYKVVYRRYAGLYFIFCVDATDNELLYLETIHLFVEVGAGHRVGGKERGAMLSNALLARWPLPLLHLKPRACRHSLAVTRRSWTTTLATCASWTWCLASTR